MSARSSASGASVGVLHLGHVRIPRASPLGTMRFKWTVWSPRRLGRTAWTFAPESASFRKQPRPANHDIRVTRCTYRDVLPPQVARGPRMLRYSADRRTVAYIAITAPPPA